MPNGTVPLSVTYYVTAGAAALLLYFVLKSYGKGVVSFLPHIKSEWRYATIPKLLDALLFSIAGAFVAVLFSQPCNLQQALLAGFTWTSLFGFISSSKQDV